MVQFSWRPLHEQFNAGAKKLARTFFNPLHEQFKASAKPQAIADVAKVAITAGGEDSHKLSSEVLESVVAKVAGREGDPTLPIAALMRRLPEEEAANELFQLAALDKNPYMQELQSALLDAGAIPALASTLCGDGTPQAKQHCALALCAMGRNSPTNCLLVKIKVEESLADCIQFDIVDASCVALVLDVLLQGDICQPPFVIDMLSSLSESNPADLKLQRRISAVLQSLVQAGAIDKTHIHKRTAPLLRTEWSDIVASFLDLETEGGRVQGRFHADTQAMFHEEVVRHFEYEAAERCLQLQEEQASGRRCLLEVIRCFTENLQDYDTRLKARDFVWDADAQRLVPLDGPVCARMSFEVGRRMEPGLILALKAAASAGDGSQGSLRRPCVLKRRHARLRSECATLLDLKTEVTQEHHETAAKLRHEVVLTKAIDYLETTASESSLTQVRTALSMFQMIKAKAPPDAVESLQIRLNHIVARHNVNAERGEQIDLLGQPLWCFGARKDIAFPSYL